MSKRPGTYNGGSTVVRTHPVGFNDEPEPEPPTTITEPILRGREDYAAYRKLVAKSKSKGKGCNFKPRPKRDK